MNVKVDKLCNRHEASIQYINFYNKNKDFIAIGAHAIVGKPKLVLHQKGQIEKVVLEIRKDSWYRMKRYGKPSHKATQFGLIHGISGIEFQTNNERYYFDLVGHDHANVRSMPNGNIILAIWGDSHKKES